MADDEPAQLIMSTFSKDIALSSVAADLVDLAEV